MKSILALLALGLSSTAHAAVTYDGFVDTAYAYDFNGAPGFDRAYTTQPARSDEFNVNLVSIGASATQDRFRGRLALQAGTSVQSNSASEPANGVVSGPLLSRHIQEAYLGAQLSDRLWVDAGIYFSHVGGESFISKNNLAYTRSLVADFSPYYQSGVRFSYAASPDLSLQFHIVNGWQNMSESNHSKMLGTQIAFAPSPKFSAVYNTLLGRESEFRQFHDLVFALKPLDLLSVLFQFDFGRQGASNWTGWTLIGRYQFQPSFSLIARIENFRDPDQVIVATATPHGFQTSSASLGVDHALAPELMWRNEVRAYQSQDAVYPGADQPVDHDALVVTSLSAAF